MPRLQVGRGFVALLLGCTLSVSACAGAPSSQRDDGLAPSAPPLPPELQSYLDAALDTLRRVSRHVGTVDWDRLRDSALVLGQGARQRRDLYPVVDWLLSRIDRHSFLQASWFGVRDADLGDRTAYLRVPFHGSPQMVPTLVDTLQNMIRRHDAAGACRWIVDLRSNGGGNTWPMLAGIGPLLGARDVATSTSPRGVATYRYDRGVAAIVHEDGRVDPQVTATTPVVQLRVPDPAVAVLIDTGTGSSGEVIAVAFKGRPRTRFFGTPTAGVSTTNAGYRLPDGANMVITVGTFVDRLGAVYGRPVQPDVRVTTPLRGPSMLRGDPVVAAALAWLTATPCAAP